MQPTGGEPRWLERCQRLLGDAPTDSREILAEQACSGHGVLLTPGQLDQPADLAGEPGFHFESVLHARHTEYVCIRYPRSAAELAFDSDKERKITDLS